MSTFQSLLKFLLYFGRKLSKLPILVGLIFIAFIVLLLIIAILPGIGRKARDKYYHDRLSPLSTWAANQSVILSDYLDLSNPNTFLIQPKIHHLYQNDAANHPASPLCGPSVQMLIMVASAPNHTDSRNAIRETWGSAHNLWRKGIRIAFVLGRSENNSLQEFIKEEAQLYDDIIQEDFLDTYHNLTLKSMAMLKWANLTCSIEINTQNNFTLKNIPQWILKTDDDMFINVDRLLQVSNDRPVNYKMIGCMISGALPVKNQTSKFYMPKYLYPLLVYPQYLSGTAYLMRAEIVPVLLEKSRISRLIHLEDVYVTGILRRTSGFIPENSRYFTYDRMDPYKDPCKFKQMVSIHQMTPTDLRTIWSSLRSILRSTCSPRKGVTRENITVYGKIEQAMSKYNVNKVI